ncbi:MAG: hypothetical protein LBC56_00495 [Oscillospiraceae bacterium]|nr:hypothetical protein [Oscillospiraceae bacterium]
MLLLKEWAEETIAPLVSFKLPDDENNAQTYEHKTAHPEIFVMALPTGDKLPPNAKSVRPAMLIELLEGKCEPDKKIRINESALYALDMESRGARRGYF